jgi:cobaltochelatase CobN
MVITAVKNFFRLACLAGGLPFPRLSPGRRRGARGSLAATGYTHPERNSEKHHKTVLLLFTILLVIPRPLRAASPEDPAAARESGRTGARCALLVIDADSMLASMALRGLALPSGIEARFFASGDLNPEAAEYIASCAAVAVDVMDSGLTGFLQEHRLVSGRTVFALRGSRDDSALAREGFVFDPEILAYFDQLSVANLQNLLRRVVNTAIDASVTFGPVQKLPQTGIFHPDAPAVFTDWAAYKAWHAARKNSGFQAPWIAILHFSSSLVPGQRETVEYGIREFEKAGFHVAACFGRDAEMLEGFVLDAQRKPRVDAVVAFTLKFNSALQDRLARALADADVPVFNAVHLHGLSIDSWRQDPVGIPPRDVVWTLGMPEVSGAAEPVPLTGKVAVRDPVTGRTLTSCKAIEENFRLLIPRVKKWCALKTMPNREKRVAVLYYNHSQGKQNVGASYLNVFRSLQSILSGMAARGYRVEGADRLTGKGIRDMILRTGRNVGAWAPGELENMTAAGDVVRVPLETYRKWFAALPESFQKAVTGQWGPPEKAAIMYKDGMFLIPAVRLGNVVLLAEPARGLAGDAMKLYHDTTVYPHHQYIAAYLWIHKEFGADALIHLGTHATYEWLPGKQAGLSPACPPEIMCQDTPNIYPYTMDDVGEGLQAKRRGRGVLIDHLTPPVTPGGLYGEYADLYEQISAYNTASLAGGATLQKRGEEIWQKAARLGLAKELGLEKPGEAAFGALEHYLAEIKTNLMPYGMHTFGISPKAQALSDFTQAIAAGNPDIPAGAIEKNLARSGPLELERLLHALEGGYIPPAEGNDPLRNPSALPTGNNFYGFNTAKIPSPAAWELGREAAEKIIQSQMEKNRKYPEQVAVVLWATETLRNEGVNECSILCLMGLAPVWDRAGRVSGVRVVPGAALGRPRVDVLINPSGLYRDLFPDKLLFLDEAVRLAARQSDVENLIAKHSMEAEKRLRAQGMEADKAKQLSGLRVFTEEPGSYGNGVSEMTSASGLWENDSHISAVYEKRTGFAYGGGVWGVPAENLLRDNLARVDVAFHSVSSNIYGLLDNDDMFQCLGGLSLAVKNARGRAPETLAVTVTDKRNANVEDVARAIGKELRTRYLNPKWIEGMKAENYAGAREMAHFAEYLWGWDATVPDSVDSAQWGQVYETYIEDKNNMGLRDFFNRNNPWAFQSMAARMLESSRKGAWTADAARQKRLAAEYAVSIVEHGPACCDHTCNNPLLNQMVANLVSIPGVVSPETARKFLAAVEKAAGKTLDKQVSERRELLNRLSAGFSGGRPVARQEPAGSRKTREKATEKREGRVVKGFRMERLEKAAEKTELASSGVQWIAGAAVLMCVALVALGALLGAGEPRERTARRPFNRRR